MARVAVSFRVALILLIGLSALWLLLIATAYWTSSLSRTASLPEPRRILALVELFERSDPADRDTLALAIESPTLRLGLGGLDDDIALDLSRDSADERVAAPYAEMLDGRDLTLLQPPRRARERRFPRAFARATNAVEFRIRLRTGEILIIESRSPVAVARIGLPVGFGAGLLGTLLALGALISLHRDIRPLVKLAAVIDRLDPSGAPIPIPRVKARSPEVRALVSAFERLQNRLATLIRARLALIGGLQHDIRSFATRLRLRVDAIPDPDERARAEADIADIIQLLDDALLASRAGVRQLDQELIDIAQLVTDDVSDRREAGLPVEVRVSADAEAAQVLGDRLALRRIVANLVDNALKYGDVAQVALKVDGGSVVLTIDDEGPGIPPDKRELLLEPFARLDDSRARRTGGAGLGLAVVRQLVEAHGGMLALDGLRERGTRVTVRLPLFDPV